MAYLVLVRHGLSEYNARGLWTGWDDPELATEGILEAQKTAEKIRDISFSFAFTSPLKRCRHTLDEILSVLRKEPVVIEDKVLNEKNYGIFTGKNKWEIKKLVGQEEFKKIRRSWDYQIPHGESLKQVYERVVEYYKNVILPKLIEGRSVLVVSSGNTLRALVKYLENISDTDIVNHEITTGEAYVYDIDARGGVKSKEVRNKNPKAV